MELLRDSPHSHVTPAPSRCPGPLTLPLPPLSHSAFGTPGLNAHQPSFPASPFLALLPPTCSHLAFLVFLPTFANLAVSHGALTCQPEHQAPGPAILPPMPCDPHGAIPSHIVRVRGLPDGLRRLAHPDPTSVTVAPHSMARYLAPSLVLAPSLAGHANLQKYQASGPRRHEGAGAEAAGGAAGGRRHASKHGPPLGGAGGAEDRHYLEERVREWLVEVCRPSDREAAKMHVTLLPAPPKSRPPISTPASIGTPHLPSPPADVAASPGTPAAAASAESGTIYSAAEYAELRAVMPTRKLAMRAVAASYIRPLLVFEGGSGEEKQAGGDLHAGKYVLDIVFEKLPVQPVRGRVLLAGLKQDVAHDLVPGIFGRLASFVSPGGVEVCSGRGAQG